MTMREFKKQNEKTIRFSTEVPEIGSIYRSNGPLPYIPSYLKIGLTGVLVTPEVKGECTNLVIQAERTYNYEITVDCSVLVDGYFVSQPPVKHDTGKKFTQSERVKFCKAIVWQMMNDETTLRETVQNIGTIHESVIVPEVIAVSAPIAPVIEDLVLPEVLNAYTHEGITGYPDGEIFKYTPDYDRLLINGMFDHGPSMLDNEIDTGFMDEIEKESIGEMFAAFNPVIIRQWNHGSMKISEVLVI